MGTATNALLTVQEVAQLVGVSDRTVRADIASGNLTVLRVAGRWIRIPRKALKHYRSFPVRRIRLLTIETVAEQTGVSVRTLRRRITRGELPAVRVSRRRLFISLRDARRMLEWPRRSSLPLQPEQAPLSWATVSSAGAKQISPPFGWLFVALPQVAPRDLLALNAQSAREALARTDVREHSTTS